jgi:predicted nucleic acid-binding protein
VGNVETGFRQTSEPFAARQAPKGVEDCFLLAYARELQAALVTFDRRLHEFARKLG